MPFKTSLVTTPLNLHVYADTLSDADRLRGKETAQGTILFVKNKPRNLSEWLREIWSKVSGTASRERHLARDAVLSQIRAARTDAMLRCDNARIDALTKLQTDLMSSVRARSMRGSELKHIADVLMDDHLAPPNGPRFRDFSRDIQWTFVDKALEALVPFNRARKMSPDELAADLAVGWRGVFEDVFKTEGGRDLGLRLVMSRGAALTHELRHFLECSMSPEDGDFSHIFVQAFRK